MLPIYLTIAYTVALLITNKTIIKDTLIIIISILVITFSGKYMYREGDYFSEHWNKYRLPNDVKLVCDYIINDGEFVTCIFPAELSCYPRQYTSFVNVVSSRGNIASYVKQGIDYSSVYNKVFVEGDFASEDSIELLNEKNVDYVFWKEPLDYEVLILDKQIGTGWLYKVVLE